MCDLYENRSADDLGEILCSAPDYPPQPCPKQQLHDIAERVLGSEYTRNLPATQPRE